MDTDTDNWSERAVCLPEYTLSCEGCSYNFAKSITFNHFSMIHVAQGRSSAAESYPVRTAVYQSDPASSQMLQSLERQAWRCILQGILTPAVNRSYFSLNCRKDGVHSHYSIYFVVGIGFCAKKIKLPHASKRVASTLNFQPATMGPCTSLTSRQLVPDSRGKITHKA